jgi:glutamate synthase (NADPH) small chain
MGQIGGFLTQSRVEHSTRPIHSRLGDWGDIAVPNGDEAQRAQAGRCMACGVAFCQSGLTFGKGKGVTGCPLHNLIPEWNDLLWRGLWREAYERLTLKNPFPEFTGRVCPALCEKACNLGLHDDATCIRDNENAIIEKAFEQGYVKPPLPRSKTGKKVAVVGSGPAGLACAWQLTQRGHDVTVFEKDDRPGGLLMYGIPCMKLPKETIMRRVELLEQAGCKIELNCPAQSTVAADFDAVVVAVGATKARALDVPGSDSEGVVLALDYLTAATKAVLDGGAPAIDACGLDVVVVGGGDTGTDCLATALRQGAKSVTQLQYHPAPPLARDASNPWPCWPNVYTEDYGQLEAAARQGVDPRQWSTNTLEVVADEAGHARQLKVCEVRWEAGKPVAVPGTERLIPADLVLVARGFAGPEPEAFGALGIAMTNGERRLPVCIGQDGEDAFKVAGRDGFFVCGDARHGASLVVNAIDEGQRCAACVDGWLRG